MCLQFQLTMHWKRPLTFHYQIHINFSAPARVPFFLNTITLSWARGNSYLWGVYRNCQVHIFPPLECTRWCIRCQIFLPKFPQGWITKSSLLYVTISYLTTPFPYSPIILCVKKHLLEEQCFAPDHTLTSSLSVSASPTDTKNFNASLLTTCTWLKSQYTVLWSCSLLNFCFIVVTMAFCPSGLLKAIENKGNVLQGTTELW